MHSIQHCVQNGQVRLSGSQQSDIDACDPDVMMTLIISDATAIISNTENFI